MWWPFISREARRRYALKQAAHAVMQDFLSRPIPARQADCRTLDIVSVDLETTGLDPRRDRIVSIGQVVVRSLEIELSSAGHAIIQAGAALPEASVIAHRITDDRSAGGQALEAVLPGLLALLSGRVLLAHHAAIELSFLDAACRNLYGSPFVIASIDTMALARRYFDRRNLPVVAGDLRLFNLRRRFNLPAYTAHNALSDALATAELFLALVADFTAGGRCPLGRFAAFR